MKINHEKMILKQPLNQTVSPWNILPIKRDSLSLTQKLYIYKTRFYNESEEEW